MPKGRIRDEQVAEYQRKGFVQAKNFFDAEEIGLLLKAAKEDRALDQHAFGRQDGEGGKVRLSLWNHPGDTIYGMFARCESIVNSAEKLLGGEVYHYHSKMIMKDAKVGGAWAWHQDYGYWYQNGVLFPLLTSAFIAVDRCDARERLPAGDQRIAPAGANRSRPDRRSGRRRHGARGRNPQAAAARLRRDGTRRRPLLPCESAASIGSEPIGESALVDDLLLQRGAQRSVQGIASSALHAAAQGTGRCHSRGGIAAVRRLLNGRRMARRQAGRECTDAAEARVTPAGSRNCKGILNKIQSLWRKSS